MEEQEWGRLLRIVKRNSWDDKTGYESENFIFGQHEIILEIFKYINEWKPKTKTNKKRD